MIGFIHEWFERHFRDRESTGHLYIEWGKDGSIRTLNNESDKAVQVADNGTITITGAANETNQ